MSSQRTAVVFELGNVIGKDFTQWRIDLLCELLQFVVYGPYGSNVVLSVSGTKIWYDETYDFHRLEFMANGHKVHVQLYKVFSSFIDEKDGWRGCPTYDIVLFANSIRNACGLAVTEI